MKYNFDEDRKQLYSALVILDAIVDKGKRFVSNLLSLDESKLNHVFQRMIDKDILTIDENHEYVPTDKGIELLNNFYQRYQEFIKFYDIYCAVDMNSAEFAFSQILDMSEEDFQKYINNERWEDLRVAVCEFKKIDPLQMIFLSFLREGRVDVNTYGWVDVLLMDDIWNEISNICNTQISSEQLQEDNQIVNIVNAGSELLKNLLERERDEQERNEDDVVTETITETTTTEEVVEDEYIDDMTYYDPYFYDPYYVSPCWGYYYYTPLWW